MLAVVAFASTQPAFAPNESGSVDIADQTWLGDAATIFALAIVVIGLVALLLALIFSKKEGVERPPQKRSILSQVALIIVVLLAARLGLFDRLRDVADNVVPPSKGTLSTEAADGVAGEVGSDPIRGVDLLSSLGLLAVFGLLLGLLAWRRRLGSAEPTQATDVHDDALRDDLRRAGGRLDDETLDHRRSVLACYDEMEHVLVDHGLARADHETPEDFLAKLRTHLGSDTAAAETLTDLVNHALYDKAPMTQDHRQQARTALDDLLKERTRVD